MRAHVVRTADDSALDTLVRLLSEYCLLDLLAATSYRCGTRVRHAESLHIYIYIYISRSRSRSLSTRALEHSRCAYVYGLDTRMVIDSDSDRDGETHVVSSFIIAVLGSCGLEARLVARARGSVVARGSRLVLVLALASAPRAHARTHARGKYDK